MPDNVPLQPFTPVQKNRDLSAEEAFYKGYKTRDQLSVGGEITALVSSPVDPNVFACASGTRIVVFSVSARGKITIDHNWNKHKSYTTALEYRADGMLLAAGDDEGHINVYSLQGSKEILRRFRGHTGGITSLAFASDKTSLISGSKDNSVKVWDLSSGDCVSTLNAHSDAVQGVKFVGDSSSLFVSAGYDEKMHLWDAEGVSLSSPPTLLHSFSLGAPADTLGCMPKSNMMVVGSAAASNRISLWDMGTKTLVSEFMAPHARALTSLAVGDSALFTGGLDGTVKVLSRTSDELLFSFKLKKMNASVGVSAVVLSKDESRIVIGTTDGHIVSRMKLEGALLKKQQSLKTSVQKYMTRGRRFKEEAFMKDDGKHNVVHMDKVGPTRKERDIDFYLRKFEYRKAVDYILANTSLELEVGMSVFDELSQRGALLAGLFDRTPKDVECLIKYLQRGLKSDPGMYMRLISHVFDIVVKLYLPLLTSNDQCLKLLHQLSNMLEVELGIQREISPLLGILEMITS